ncbi:MAG: SPFH/Band 7/PHB domain protein [Lachnospiraceae bacterium]|nr:SPFH/Band 7/PHB domain protein [Lachnospiraceae bacterium]
MGIVLVLIVLLVVVVISCVKIVPQANAYVIERLGAYRCTWSVGLHFKTPFIDKIAKKVNLKEQVADYPPQPVITKDNVTMQIDSVLFYQITDPKLYAYDIDNPMLALANLTATTLRNIIGDLDLDQTLTSREVINSKMREVLDIATDPWGIKVNRVELKNIIPPEQIREAMEKQMKAERDKRKDILEAEGSKQSQILVAEGKKESAVLEAEAAKQAEILKAEADKQAAILRAEAEKQAAILRAQGEAEAIIRLQQANADGIRAVKEAGADQAVLTMKSLDAFKAAADGQSTKIIIPSDLQGLAGLATTFSEVVNNK